MPVEPVVRPGTPMPRDYVFVPSGDRYVTGNCRRHAQAAGATVYVVANPRTRRPLGIRVPGRVLTLVREAERETRGERRQATQRRDEALAARFRDAVTRLFPRAPQGDGSGPGKGDDTVSRIVEHAAKKGSRRVGRTGMLDLDEKAVLAVHAHIRHTHTDYEKLFRDGLKKDEARKQTLPKVNEVSIAWGGPPVAQSRRDKGEKGTTKTKNTRRGKRSRRSKKSKSQRHPDAKRGGAPRGRTPPSPKERRLKKLETRRDRAAASSTKEAPRKGQPATKGGDVGDDKIGRSLRDDLSDIEESEEYVSSDGSYEWDGSDDENDSDSDWS